MQFSISIALIGYNAKNEAEKLQSVFPFVIFKTLDFIDNDMIYDFDIVVCGEDCVLHKNLLCNRRLRCIVYTKSQTLVFNNSEIDYSLYCVTDILTEIILILDNQPFITSAVLASELFKNKASDKCLEKNMEYSAGVINSKRVAIVVIGKDSSYAENILKFSNENVVAYYDITKEKFIHRYSDEKQPDFDTIYILNTLNSPASKTGIELRFPTYNKVYIGQFGESENYEDIYYKNLTKEFKTPITIISSFGPEMGKFDVLCELSEQFKNNQIPIECVSSNPCASVISTMRYVTYPQFQDFQTTVRKIRDLMSDIEEDNNELVIWDIPGGCTQVDNLRTDYGGLTYACLCALRNVDVAILCFNSQINIQLVKQQCALFEAFGVSKVVLVQSDMVYLRTMIAEGKLSVYEDVNSEKSEIDGYSVFSMNELKEGKLYNYLFELFTSEDGCEK